MITEIFERAHSQCLTQYLLYGNETVPSKDPKKHDERIDNSFELFYKGIKEKYPFINENDDFIYSLISELTTTHDEVFMEIGLIVGLEIGMYISSIKGEMK